jgi:hypothetical protein
MTSKKGFNLEQFTTDWIQYYQSKEDEDAEAKEGKQTKREVVVEKCINNTTGCNRKRRDQCCHSMCFPCCMAACALAESGTGAGAGVGAGARDDTVSSGNPSSSSSSSSSSIGVAAVGTQFFTVCQAHLPDLQAKEAEDRYFEEGFNALHGSSTSKYRNKTRFYHYESQFDKHGETVVIWCLKDFVRHREYSEATLKLHHDAERRKRVRMRRDAALDSSFGGTDGGGGDTYSFEKGLGAVAAKKGKQMLDDWVEREFTKRGGKDVSRAWLQNFSKINAVKNKNL